MIGAPEYGKDIVDTINTCDNQYLRSKMYMVGTYPLPELHSLIVLI